MLLACLLPSRPDDSLALIGRAIAAAPERPDLAWLQAQVCQEVTRCDPEPIERHLRGLDPSNGAGWMGAPSLPAYSGVSNACKGERLQRAEIIEACRGVAGAFERGDTYITEMIGIAIAKRVWPADSPEWKAAAEARGVFEYRSKFWPALDKRDMSHAEEYLTLCAQNRREQDVLLARLIAAGKNTNPPPE